MCPGQGDGIQKLLFLPMEAWPPKVAFPPHGSLASMRRKSNFGPTTESFQDTQKTFARHAPTK